MNELNLYTLDNNKRYKFMATVGVRVVDEIHSKHWGPRTPDYWNKERIILNNVKIFNGSEYVDFEPTIKMDLGKQFKTTSEYDIITFNACVGTIDTYCGDYDEDDRGNFILKVSKEIKHGRFITINEIKGTKSELKEIVKDNRNYLRKDNIYHSITCYEVRRLIRPTKLEIVSKAPGLDVA